MKVSDIRRWLIENGYMYNSDGILDPEISLEESQRMIDELMKENSNGDG